MAENWNGPIDETTDWAHVDFIAPYFKAVNERILTDYILNPANYIHDPFPVPVVGVFLGAANGIDQLMPRIDTITLSGTTATATASLHNLAIGDFIVIDGAVQDEYNGLHQLTTVPSSTTFTYEVTGAPATPATKKAHYNRIRYYKRDTTAFSHMDLMYWVGTKLLNYIQPSYVGSGDNLDDYLLTYVMCGLHADGFRRMRPREVNTTNATSDISGNAAVTGQRAMYLGSPLVLVRYDGALWIETETPKAVTSLTRTGTVATCTCSGHGFSTGNRVKIAGVTTPGWNGGYTITVTGTNTFTFTITGSPGTPASGASKTAGLYLTGEPDALDSDAAAPNNMPYGIPAEGDYIGAWNFEELRACLNAMTRPGYGITYSTTDTNNVRSGSGASQAGATTAYGTNAPSTSATGVPRVHTRVDAGGTSYSVFRRYNQPKATLNNPDGLTCNAVLYVQIRSPQLVASSIKVYDKQGDAVLPGTATFDAWYKIDTQTGLTTTYDGPVIGAGTVPSVWGAADTATGFELDATDSRTRLVLDFGISGGYTYIPAA